MASLFEASKFAIVGLLAVNIVNLVIYLQNQGMQNANVSLVISVIGDIILMWAGYNSVKRFGFDNIGAILTGLFTGFFSGLIGTTLGVAFAASTTSWSPAGVAAFKDVSTYVVVLLDVFIASANTAIIGAILGCIGGLIAGGKHKNAK